MTDGDSFIELIPAYALDCLDAEDTAQVRAHLAECQRCQLELRRYREISTELIYALPQVDPPARVKEGLMARVAMQEQQRLTATEPEPGIELARRTAAPAQSWWETILQGLRQSAPVWGAAGLLLILLLGISNLLLWREVGALRTQTSPDQLQVIQLSGTEFVPAATGMIVVSVDGQHGALVVDRLPVLDEAHEYQLWLIRDEERDSGAVFSVDEDGYATKYVSSPEPLDGYTSFGITIEPAGGSPGPTGEKVLGGEF